AAVAGDPDGPVVGPYVKHVRVEWRFGECRGAASVRRRDFRGDCAQFVASVERFEDKIAGGVENLRVVSGENERRFPVEAVPLILLSDRADRVSFAGAYIDATHVAVLAGEVDLVGIVRIDLANESVAAADGDPIIVDRAAPAAYGTG